MKKIAMMLAVVVLSVNVLSAAIVTTDTFDSSDGQSQFDIDFVTISGDTNPTSGYGQVTGDYRMGMLEIRDDQFDFNNPYYSGGAFPANNVTWFEAAQFVNHLNTSKGYQAAYNIVGNSSLVTWSAAEAAGGTNLFRHKDAFYFLPTEDEWVKAAYWNSTTSSLQTYATTDGSIPDAGVDTNYDDVFGLPWYVGYGLEELNGTKNMMGNVWEWMESPYPYSSGAYTSGSGHGIRGGSFANSVSYLSSSSRLGYNPSVVSKGTGFRVASNVPEPCSLVLLGLGGLILRNRKR